MFTLAELQAKITQFFNPAIGEYGQDYAVPVGTPIYSPVSGTFSSQDLGKADWGKRAFVILDKASAAVSGFSTFAVGHLTSFAAVPGEHVNAGQLIGYSGGAASDPSSGVSTGPHVETQFLASNGSPINPKTIFAKFGSFESAIFNGLGSAAGTASSQASSLDPLAGIAGAIGQATSDVTTLVTRLAIGGVLGLTLLVVGLGLIFAGDIEKLIGAGQDASQKAAETSATAAELAA